MHSGNKNESLVDLAADLGFLPARAFPKQKLATMEEELIEQLLQCFEFPRIMLGHLSNITRKSGHCSANGVEVLKTLFAVENSKKISEKDTKVNMANHTWSNQNRPLEHAQINTAGSKDEKLPQWTKGGQKHGGRSSRTAFMFFGAISIKS